MLSLDNTCVNRQAEKKENELIANLDPLNADELIERIPELNKTRDVRGLTSIAISIMPTAQDLADFDPYEANAAIRDIGLLLGSIKRHGIEPFAVIPNLEATMEVLASKTSMPPRDTLLHYTVWNPTNRRRRTYTDARDEHFLIDSVVTALDPLVNSIRLLRQLHRTSMRSPDFKEICDELSRYFQRVIDGIVLARRNVSLSYFASELRLYFDPIKLRGREYLGPGAVEMPMFVFDHLLWSCDCDDHEYRIFKETYLPYVHPDMREIFREFENADSLLSRCYHDIVRRNIDFDPVVYESMSALRLCFQQLKSFRMPHKKVADEAYAYAGNAHGGHGCKYATGQDYRTNGSGGYSPGILAHIVNLTNQKAAMLDGCISFYQLKIRK